MAFESIRQNIVSYRSTSSLGRDKRRFMSSLSSLTGGPSIDSVSSLKPISSGGQLKRVADFFRRLGRSNNSMHMSSLNHEWVQVNRPSSPGFDSISMESVDSDDLFLDTARLDVSRPDSPISIRSYDSTVSVVSQWSYLDRSERFYCLKERFPLTDAQAELVCAFCDDYGVSEFDFVSQLIESADGTEHVGVSQHDLMLELKRFADMEDRRFGFPGQEFGEFSLFDRRFALLDQLDNVSFSSTSDGLNELDLFLSSKLDAGDTVIDDSNMCFLSTFLSRHLSRSMSAADVLDMLPNTRRSLISHVMSETDPHVFKSFGSGGHGAVSGATIQVCGVPTRIIRKEVDEFEYNNLKAINHMAGRGPNAIANENYLSFFPQTYGRDMSYHDAKTQEMTPHYFMEDAYKGGTACDVKLAGGQSTGNGIWTIVSKMESQDYRRAHPEIGGKAKKDRNMRYQGSGGDLCEFQFAPKGRVRRLKSKLLRQGSRTLAQKVLRRDAYPKSPDLLMRFLLTGKDHYIEGEDVATDVRTSIGAMSVEQKQVLSANLDGLRDRIESFKKAQVESDFASCGLSLLIVKRPPDDHFDIMAIDPARMVVNPKCSGEFDSDTDFLVKPFGVDNAHFSSRDQQRHYDYYKKSNELALDAMLNTIFSFQQLLR